MELIDYTNEELIFLKEKINKEIIDRGITPSDRFEVLNRKKCIDCGCLITRKSKRCFSCAVKNRDNSKLKDNLRIFFGDKNAKWKGDNVGYYALHEWIRKYKPKPKFCEECNKNKPYDVANISGEYKRDINDFKWVCRKCHYKLDNKTTPERDERGRFINGK